jgi:cell division cycle 2-like protein
LKQIKFDSEMTKEGFPVTALREISVLLSLSHENVVSVREMVVGSSFDKVFMVMEVSGV